MRMLSPLSTYWSLPRRAMTASDVFEDFDRIVESVLKPAQPNWNGFLPSCDINESEDHVMLSFDVPGVKKEDIHIEVKGNSLIISGERRNERNNKTTIRHEKYYGKFERSFELPNSINAEKIEAHFENGVLNIALPKAEAEKGRTIQIQSGETSFFSKLLGSKSEPAALKTQVN